MEVDNFRATTRITLLGVNLRRLRLQRGWSITHLAEVSGVSKSVISRIEAGQQRTAQDDNLHALAVALEVDGATLRELGQHPVGLPPELIDASALSEDSSIEPLGAIALLLEEFSRADNDMDRKQIIIRVSEASQSIAAELTNRIIQQDRPQEVSPPPHALRT